ncbi:ATP-binding cassette domain-containing protein [Lactonifactor sp. BIOML-A3]|uniref:ABC transporter ATP-binding protein n=1 Tax=unclassified Lactonifactor TaxID=2636670 RepID=UPI0012B0FC91|nr:MULTISPECIES: ABC transporter ATP-binding protein [unclassified Lactonifactor]MSA03304.1 ATP-binding cassette domain-containing protein [Lactonifactor sp. BIOML-A5]MSA09653.1 ATP-binding cassette domain-containing protein [Lactonifactor sp. BIOML-A4]MSA14195.1 ATP-binding cassette domain-containing protein [Lactonifactor sp. BIOML-A3]MSA18658.1 ATP-binding cassette domain-containing protein [Lactonifactor sp. BIOML-A2]MSA39440.1 ATP-binding cassette domain-containing protein [Lactonifactor 
MKLEIKDVSFSYGKDRILFKNVSFTLDKGRIFSVLGANGAGKSTLLKCIANLLRPCRGEICLDGVSLHRMEQREVARKIGYVPQTHTAAYGYLVRDFVVMGRAPYLRAFEKPSGEEYRMAEEVLEEMEIIHLADRPYTELSGGEAQKVMIARTIVQQPDIILMDEPTNHLDYGNQMRMMKMIMKLAGKGFGILMTSHMPDHVLLLEGEVGILNDEGEFITGKAADIMTEDNLSRLYRAKLDLVFMEELNRKICICKDVCDDYRETV